ncbi:MAG: hypothetical protein E2O82_00320 [Betaproteobacteria bacterium]|nr:MAG: hypothetical protein E2O82_00320 [Betaproteobacteria bacterium]
MTTIAVLHKDEILKRVAKGDQIADIGKTYGVFHAAIRKRLLKDPEWIEAHMSGAEWTTLELFALSQTPC